MGSRSQQRVMALSRIQLRVCLQNPGALVFGIILTLLLPAFTHARMYYERGEMSLFTSGFVKNLFGIYWYSDRLATVFGRENAQGFDACRIRLKVESLFPHNVTFVAHYESLPRIIEGAESDSTPEYAEGIPPQRFLDLTATIIDNGNVLWEHTIDRLYVGYESHNFQLRIGRQDILWGNGQIWSPGDLFGSFLPTEIDREEKAGVDAIRGIWTIEPKSQAELVYAPGARHDLYSLGMRGQITTWDANVYLLALTSRRQREFLANSPIIGDFQLGCGGLLPIKTFMLHAESTWTNPQEGASFFRGILGMDYVSLNGWFLFLEYYFNGFGTRDSADYPDKFMSPRFLTGEISNVAKNYLGAIGGYQLTQTLQPQVFSVFNLDDGSYIINPSLGYLVLEELEVVAGGYIYQGTRPRDEAIPDEFGVFPNLFYLQVKTYF